MVVSVKMVGVFTAFGGQTKFLELQKEDACVADILPQWMEMIFENSEEKETVEEFVDQTLVMCGGKQTKWEAPLHDGDQLTLIRVVNGG